MPEEAVPEVVVGRVHSISKFQHLIPDDECPISPIVEFKSKSLGDNDPVQCDKPFILTLPHCVPNIDQMVPQIRVRYGNIHSETLNLPAQKADEVHHEVCYKISSKFITIQTTQLTGFLVTVQDSKCSSRSSTLQVYGSFENSRVKLQPILCSPLWSIQDYQQVCHMKR